MTHAAATELIRDAFHDLSVAQRWADLGCGSGLFTMALTSQLAANSTIYAVDQRRQQIPSALGVTINFIEADFENEALSFTALDGILMANAFHFVKDKDTLLKKLIQLLNPCGRFIIVEYDTTSANHWVPYPIPYHSLASVFSQFGFDQIRKIGERPSLYGPQKMYAAIISRG